MKLQNICNSFIVKTQQSLDSPGPAWTGPEGSRRLRLSEFLDSRRVKVVRMSAPRTGRLYPQEILKESTPEPWCGRKNLNGPGGNRTRELPACPALPQPTAPPRPPLWSQCKGHNDNLNNWEIFPFNRHQGQNFPGFQTITVCVSVYEWTAPPCSVFLYSGMLQNSIWNPLPSLRDHLSIHPVIQLTSIW
jgi:hypothetical protein